jgi:hypothetical protein
VLKAKVTVWRGAKIPKKSFVRENSSDEEISDAELEPEIHHAYKAVPA